MTKDSRVAVFLDFDDTLTTENIAQLLLRSLAPQEFDRFSREYRAGKITFRDYQEFSFNAVNASLEEIKRLAADQAELRPGITELITAVEESDGTITVLSAGLDIYIEPVRQKHGFDSLNVICGTASRVNSDTGPFRYDYPFGSTAVNGCRGDWATCKCKALEQVESGTTKVFVGDGSTSDACVAEKADYVFARDRLLRICNELEIKATRFEDFAPVTEFVNSLTTSQKV